MSNHTEHCPNAHGLVCHFQHHRTSPEKPFVYQSPVNPGLWRVAVKPAGEDTKMKAYWTRERAHQVAALAAAGDYRALDVAA